MYKILIGLTLCLAHCFGFTEYPPEFVAQVQTYPNIMQSKDQCLPLKGNYEHAQTYVCDPSRLLTVTQINRLNSMLQEIRNMGDREEGGCNPNNPHPVVAVALVNKLKVGNEVPDTLLSYASIFAYYLFNEWSLPSTCHTGSDKMIIFYSKDDGVLYTFAGNLLEKKLSSQQLINIAVQARLPFTNGIHEGLAYLIQRYREAISTGRADIFSKV
ncbi:unnamed protein product [Calicophoron daubneyi]|uniref:Uncharacterized protein n=1 Tax=Calicophoron daubneyi TaxID=300641 RepID=A0AAV2TZ56_CALDB